MTDYSRNAWKYYEFGRAYNNSLTPNQYRLVETNTEFFAGNQWINMPDNEAMRRLAKPTFNIIKRITSMFVANLTSSGTTISFEPLAGRDDGEAAGFATEEVRNLLEKFKMDFRIRDALFDAAVSGDYCAHFFWNPEARPYGGVYGDYRGEIEMELVDGINVMFGNPNTTKVEKQPYIIIVGRDTVENLKAEALYWAKRRMAEAEAADAAAMAAQRAQGAEVHIAGWNDAVQDARAAGAGKEAAGASGGFPFIDPLRTGAQGGAGNVSGVDGESDEWKRPSGLNGVSDEWKRLTGMDFLRSERRPEDFLDGIVKPDPEWEATGGGRRNEINGDDDKSAKATYIYLYTKQRHMEPVRNEQGVPLGTDGLPLRIGMQPMMREVTTVFVTKATRSCTIYGDIDTGLSRYPVVWGVWQKQKNQYHGRALVTEVIPNQIFINQMMAMIFRHLQTQAFPTKVFNADLLPGVSNEVGTAIGVRNLLPGQSLGTAISTIPAADMSNQIISAIELCMTYTKECLGATDAQLGNLEATNTSALMVLQNASEVPLENTRAGLNEWVEDIGGILLDMMGTYYGLRPVQKVLDIDMPVLGADGQPLIDPMTGQPAVNHFQKEVLQEYDFGKFKNLWFSIAVDVGATTYYSEIAMVQTLDNLRKDGALDIIDYLERIPDKLINKKQDLIRKIREREGIVDADGSGISGTVAAGTSASGGKPGSGYAMGGALDSAKRIQSMPSVIQGRYNSLPVKAQNALQSLY